MFCIYILENLHDKSWYIGYTSNLKRRFTQHITRQGAETTKRKPDWRLMYCEGYLDRRDAKGRERFLKSGAGRRFLKKQLKHYLGH